MVLYWREMGVGMQLRREMERNTQCQSKKTQKPYCFHWEPTNSVIGEYCWIDSSFNLSISVIGSMTSLPVSVPSHRPKTCTFTSKRCMSFWWTADLPIRCSLIIQKPLYISKETHETLFSSTQLHPSWTLILGSVSVAASRSLFLRALQTLPVWY